MIRITVSLILCTVLATAAFEAASQGRKLEPEQRAELRRHVQAEQARKAAFEQGKKAPEDDEPQLVPARQLDAQQRAQLRQQLREQAGGQGGRAAGPGKR